MKMPPKISLPGRDKAWNAVDLAEDGRMVGVTVSTRATHRKPRVLACAKSSGVAMGPQALDEIVYSLPRGQWTTVLSRDDYRMLVVPEPPVLESEIESSLRWSLGSMVEFPPNEASLAWMRIPTTEFDPALEKHLYAVVARNSIVEERASLFSAASVSLSVVDVRETALRNIAALASPGSGVALVSLSPSGVSTIFTFRGELYLDRFIAQSMDEVMSDPQRWRRFLDRLAVQVNQSLELMSRSFAFASIPRVLIAPSERAGEVAQHLASSIGHTVETLNLETLFDFEEVPQLESPAAQGEYLVALGAALRGIK